MKARSWILVGLVAASASFSACSLLNKDDDKDKDPTTKGTAGAPPIGEGGQKGEGGSKPVGGGICGLKTGELALKAQSEKAEGHSHLVDIPIVNLQKRTPGAFTLQTNKEVMHTHIIRLSNHDFQVLEETGKLTVTSTKTEGHKHDVNLVCPK